MKRTIVLLVLLLLLPLIVNAQTTVTLLWDYPDNPDPEIAGFLMYRSTTSGSGYVVVSDTLTVREFDVSLNTGDVFYYIVVAVSLMSIESDPSNELPIDMRKPAPPTGLIVTI